MTVRHLSFDFWNTLASPNPAYSRERVIYLSQISGLGRESAKAAYVRAKRNVDRIAEVTGQSFETMQVVLLFLHEAGRSVSLANSDDIALALKIERQLQRIALAYPPIISLETASSVREAKRAGFTLGVISNTNFVTGDTLREVLTDNGLVFDHFLFSDENIHAKPNPGIFRSMLNQMNLSPSEVIHFGDHLVCDVAGAQNVGIKAVHVPMVDDLPDLIQNVLPITA